MVHGRKYPEPALPSFTLVLKQHQHSKRRRASVYKPKVDHVGAGVERQGGIRDDWALTTIDRRFDDSDVLTPMNQRLRARASYPRMRRVQFGSCTRIDEHDETSDADVRVHGKPKAISETKMTSPPLSSSSASASTSVNVHDRSCRRDITDAPIKRTLPVPSAPCSTSLEPAATASTSQSLFPPSATLRPSDDASSEISELVLGEAVSEPENSERRRPCDSSLSSGESASARDGDALQSSSTTPTDSSAATPPKSDGSPGGFARITRSTSPNPDVDIKSLPSSLTDLRPFLCSSPIMSSRTKSMSLDSEVDTPPHTPTPSLRGGPKPKAPIHLLQPYDDKTFTVEVQYVEAKRGLGGKFGEALTAILKALHVNVKTQEKKTVNKAINKIMLPH